MKINNSPHFPPAKKQLFLYIKVQAAAKRAKIIKRKNDHWEIAVREPAARGEANRAILAILRQNFPQAKIKLLHGAHWTKKLFLIEM